MRTDDSFCSFLPQNLNVTSACFLGLLSFTPKSMQGTCFNCSRKPVVVSSYLNYSHEVLAGHSVQARPVGSLRRRLAPSFPGQRGSSAAQKQHREYMQGESLLVTRERLTGARAFGLSMTEGPGW